MATSRDRRSRRAPRLLGLRVAAVRPGRPCPAPACDGAACACGLQRGRVTQPGRAHDRALTVGAWLDGAAARGRHTCCGVAADRPRAAPPGARVAVTPNALLAADDGSERRGSAALDNCDALLLVARIAALGGPPSGAAECSVQANARQRRRVASHDAVVPMRAEPHALLGHALVGGGIARKTVNRAREVEPLLDCPQLFMAIRREEQGGVARGDPPDGHCGTRGELRVDVNDGMDADFAARPNTAPGNAAAPVARNAPSSMTAPL